MSVFQSSAGGYFPAEGCDAIDGSAKVFPRVLSRI